MSDARQPLAIFRPPFLEWGPAKILYLAYLAKGLNPVEIVKKLPNSQIRNPKTGKPKLGIGPEAVANWRQRDGEWLKAEQMTLTVPGWFHTAIALPLKLAAVDAHDLEFMLGVTGRWEFNAKARELLLAELRLLDQAPDPSDIFKHLVANIKIVMPPEALADANTTADQIIDLLPVTHEESHAE